MFVCTLTQEETEAALELALRVFMQFEAPEYSMEGIESFQSTIRDAAYRSSIVCYGAFVEHALVGMLATRNAGRHITLLFVEAAYHRQGIARKLFETALAGVDGGDMTVNASPYGVEAYRRLGFTAEKPEQLTDGICYTPMRFHRAAHQK